MSGQNITHRERLEICLSGERPDRVPVALWRHFPVDDQTPDGLASAVLAFQHRFDFDLVKVTPASSFCIKDWGAQDEWRGATEGTRDYTQPVIQHPEDWGRLPILDPTKGHLAAQLECLRLLYAALGPDTPIIQTIFNPLSQAKNLVGKGRLLTHLRRHPSALNIGLQTITDSTIRFIEAARQTGIAGVFFAAQHAQYGLLTPGEYQEFGCAYDLQALEPAMDMWLNMLHLHGVEIMFDSFVDYPVSVINWHDQETIPSLGKGLSQFSGAVCGGLQRYNSLVLGTPGTITAEARAAIEETGGQRFILGTGCVVPITAPYGNLLAVRKSVNG